MWSNGDGTYAFLNYMSRRQQAVMIHDSVTKNELAGFCENAAMILRNLATLFDALAAGTIGGIYYPDEDLGEAVEEFKKREGE